MPAVQKSISDPVGIFRKVQNVLGAIDAEANKAAPSMALAAAAMGLAMGVGLPFVACMAVAGVGFGIYNGNFQNALKNPLEEFITALTGVALAVGTVAIAVSGIGFIAAASTAGALGVGVLGAKAALSSSQLAAVRHEAKTATIER